ncbi:MAG: ChbG/HpnK family deacetylase, partial [Planctomycetes bacterium]|nr:ChbG/HpnK family deacetylase [Planctomycetota bacterium]
VQVGPHFLPVGFDFTPETRMAHDWLAEQGGTAVAGRRRLIINADDFGLSPGVNEAVAQAHRRGVLTSATILANGPHFAEAAAMAKSMPTLGVGVHLNLVRGKPVSPASEVPNLIDAAGLFKPFRWRTPWPDFLREAGLEYRRQVEKALDAGIVPTHVDFEKHHAWQGELYQVAANAAAACGIGGIRCLEEPVAWSVRKLGWGGVSAVAMAAALRTGVTLFGGGGDLARPDRLLGGIHIGKMTEPVWLRLAANLPAGVSEVMVHPCLPEPDPVAAEAVTAAMGSNRLERREEEFSALISPAVRQALRFAGIELINFREI